MRCGFPFDTGMADLPERALPAADAPAAAMSEDLDAVAVAHHALEAIPAGAVRPPAVALELVCAAAFPSQLEVGHRLAVSKQAEGPVAQRARWAVDDALDYARYVGSYRGQIARLDHLDGQAVQGDPVEVVVPAGVGPEDAAPEFVLGARGPQVSTSQSVVSL